MTRHSMEERSIHRPPAGATQGTEHRPQRVLQPVHSAQRDTKSPTGSRRIDLSRMSFCYFPIWFYRLAFQRPAAVRRGPKQPIAGRSV